MAVESMRESTSVEAFEAHRPLLVSITYRMLGSLAEAEDVVQEAWLRWSQLDQAEVANTRAFLVRMTTRLAIDRLRRLKARRESYIGPWLPEPVLTERDVAEDIELAESVSLALLVVLRDRKVAAAQPGDIGLGKADDGHILRRRLPEEALDRLEPFCDRRRIPHGGQPDAQGRVRHQPSRVR